MKLVVLLLVTCLQVSAGSFGQGTVTLSVKDAPVTEVFREIEKQTSFRFLYRDELVKKAGHVTISVKDAPVGDVLDKCFSKSKLEYKIFNATIVISEKGEEVHQGGGSSVPEVALPPINVTGRVLNEQGKPVEGVTVTIKGSDKSTYTNANGEFSLSSVEQDAVLIFTSVNMETFEYRVSGRTELVVNLKAKVSELGNVEVVVNTGYQQLPKERATGSFSFVSEDELDRRVATDIISKLEGITNGLVFNKDPLFGTNKMRVRGESTIFANPNPLIVVDNFPYDGDINNINPNDVESVTLLKDAAAASIWGVQAGNGVIVITTKKGKLNRPVRLELNSNITITEKPDVYYAPQVNSTDFIDLELFLFDKGYYNSRLLNDEMPAVSPVVEILNDRKLGKISAQDSAERIDALRGIDYRDDLSRHMYERGINSQYQLNISGGGDKTSYYVSAGYDKNILNVIGNETNRITFNSQTTYSPLKNLDFRAGIFYTENTRLQNGGNSIPNVFPYMRLLDDQGNQIAIPQHRAQFEDTVSNSNFPSWKYYPLQERNFVDNKGKIFDTRIIASVKYNFLKDFGVELTYQYQRSVVKDRNLLREGSYSIRNRINTFAILDANGDYVGTNFPVGGILTLNNSDLAGHYGRISFSFNKLWGFHGLTAIGGFEARQVETEASSSYLYGYDEATGTFVVPNLNTEYLIYPSRDYSSLGSEGGLTYQGNYSGTSNRFRSFFGNAAYTYRGRYIVSASARLDGSNYFGVKTNNKTVPLWSTGFKWNISEEKFYNFSTIPTISIRLTYGFNGNLAQNLAALTTTKYVSNALYTGLPYAVINNVPNPQLRWEKISQFNAGVDFASRNNRISGSIEYFIKHGNDLIGDKPIDPTTGVTQLRGNFSGMESKGVDVRLTSVNVDRRFRWSTTLIFNYAEEKVTRFDIQNYVGSSFLTSYYDGLPIVGRPLYSLYSYRWAGLDPSNGGPRIYLADTILNTYNSSIADKMVQSDFIYSGRFNPPIVGSITNSISWNNISLTANIVYKLNYFFRRKSFEYTTFINDWQKGHSDFANRWQKPGDEAITDVPSLIFPGNQVRDRFYSGADIMVERGDHLRLQFVSLSYLIGKRVLGNGLIKGIQINAYANNVGIIWRANDKKIDPDYPLQGFPPSRTYSFGIQATF